MSETSNSKNSNYSNFSFANYLKNPADIGKNEYETYSNNNLEDYTESFYSADNNQNENIANFGVGPKSISAGISHNENDDKIKLIDYTKSVPKATFLDATEFGPNFITGSAKNPLDATGLGPNFITGFAKNTKFVSKVNPLDANEFGPNFITGSAKTTKFVSKLPLLMPMNSVLIL